MQKRILATILFLCLLISMAACSTRSADNEGPSNGYTDNGPSGSGSGDAGDDGEEITEVNFWCWDLTGNGGTGGESTPEIEAAINAITEKEIGVHVNFTWIGMADYGTQISLAMANNETIDVACYIEYNCDFITIKANGYTLDITDLLDEYGQDLKETVGEGVLGATTIDGRIWGIPTFRVLNSNNYLIYRVDALEQADALDAFKSMQTWTDFEAVLAALADKTDMYPICGSRNQGIFQSEIYANGEKLSDTYKWDSLGDTLGLVWSSQTTDEICCSLDRPEAVESYKMLADWNNKGYIWPDSAYTTEGGDSPIKMGTCAGQQVFSEIGVESQKRDQFGTEVVGYKLASGFVTTSAGRKLGIYIPFSSGEPEAAMKFINLWYTSPEINNLIDWGLEDVNYIVNEKGEAQFKEGQSASDCGYHFADWAVGNQFLALPWLGSGGDFRTVAYEDYINAPVSKYMSLAVNTASSDNLIAALAAVMDEYSPSVRNGLYTDALYAEYLQKLSASGIDEYIELFRTAAAEFSN